MISNLGHILLNSFNFPPKLANHLDLFVPLSCFLSVSLLGWMFVFPLRILVLLRGTM